MINNLVLLSASSSATEVEQATESVTDITNIVSSINAINTVGGTLLIMLVCYIVGVFLKKVFTSKNIDTQLISPILMIIGGIIGAVIYAVDPAFMGMDGVMNAIIVGVIAGFASSGVKEFLKNFTSKKNTDEDDSNN